MTKLVKENLNEFVRGGDPLNTLGIGRFARIRNLFRDLGVPDEDYEITQEEVIFNTSLNLQNNQNVVWLPDNLKINGYVNLGYTPIPKLPNGLKILNGWGLLLRNTKITELPEDLQISGKIYVDSYQTELIDYILYKKRFKVEID